QAAGAVEAKIKIMLVRGAGQRQTVFRPRFPAISREELRCRAQNKLRREEVGGGLLRRWEQSLGPCRWQAVRPLQVRLAIWRRRTPHRVILGEEEISDVSLATFYVFDKENGPIHGVRLAQLSINLGHGGHHGGCGHGGR